MSVPECEIGRSNSLTLVHDANTPALANVFSFGLISVAVAPSEVIVLAYTPLASFGNNIKRIPKPKF